MATAHIRTAGQRFSAEDRRQQILETATELFARQGYEGTTTRQIAHLARVNEAIIFRHFPSKEELYWAVIEHKCEEGHGAAIVADCIARGAPPEETFAAIAGEFLSLRENDTSLGRLLLYSALENHKLSQRFFETHIAELYQALAQYVREQIEAGRFRDVDPLMAARAFWGMVVYHFLIQEIFGAKRYQRIDIREAGRTMADVWLHGMLPRTPHDAEAGASKPEDRAKPAGRPVSAKSRSRRAGWGAKAAESEKQIR